MAAGTPVSCRPTRIRVMPELAYRLVLLRFVHLCFQLLHRIEWGFMTHLHYLIGIAQCACAFKVYICSMEQSPIFSDTFFSLLIINV